MLMIADDVISVDKGSAVNGWLCIRRTVSFKVSVYYTDIQRPYNLSYTV